MKKKKVSDKAVDYILSCKNEDLKNLNVNHIAVGIGANRSYLSRIFKQEQEISLSRFIRREKIHRAVFTLESQAQIDIHELSKELGFLETTQFINQFKSYLAIDPERYQYLKMKKRLLRGSQ